MTMKTPSVTLLTDEPSASDRLFLALMDAMSLLHHSRRSLSAELDRNREASIALYRLELRLVFLLLHHGHNQLPHREWRLLSNRTHLLRQLLGSDHDLPPFPSSVPT